MTLGEWLNSMIMEDGEEDEGYATLPRRPQVAEAFERRGRSRRLDDAYDSPDEHWLRLSASVDVIASRLEAAERRSTVAIQGVDQAVAGLVRRLEAQDTAAKTQAERSDELVEEMREGQKRLRKFEQDHGPRTLESFGKIETSIGALAGRLYEIEERQRGGVNELRTRMDAVEKAAARAPAGTLSADALAQVGQRLDQAQGRTTAALRNLERSFADLDKRLHAAEARIEPEGAREAVRFEKLAETLARQVEGNRIEMMRRLDDAEAEDRMDRLERALSSVGDQVKASEEKSAEGIEAMGREVVRIAQNLGERLTRAEGASPATQMEAMARALAEKVDGEVAHKAAQLSSRIEADIARRLAKAEADFASKAAHIDGQFSRQAERIEQRLTAADDRHAVALERLGGEITRISERLSERIAQTERRSQQALDDIGQRLAESSTRIEQRYDRASGELAERMRLSEERTARLLAEARESIDQRTPTQAAAVSAPPAHASVRDMPLEAEEVAPELAPDAAQADWRAAAFPDASFDADDDWGDIDAEAKPAPAATQNESPTPPGPFGASSFSSFGGADVSDALDATADAAAPVPPKAEARPAVQPIEDAEDDFSADTDFVDPRRLRASMSAAAAEGRAASTRSTIDAARAAMTPAVAEAPSRLGFGLNLRRGGKSKLQERLDKQAAQDGSTAKKALLASVTAVAVTGGLFGLNGLAEDNGLSFGLSRPGDGVASASDASAVPLAAVALTPTDAGFPGEGTRGAETYARAVEQLDANDPAGVETLRAAANLGNPSAQLHLAGLYQAGERGVDIDLAESRRWARRAAEGGDPKGMHAYAMYLYDGVGGGQNRSEALKWLTRGAELGLTDSQYNVARLYENGAQGVAPNTTQALKWYAIAARSGDAEARAAYERLNAGASPAARQIARRAADAFQASDAAG
ncbi:SEL1-like repeat protein [Brevundimonas sp. PAMC22021]|nr:SEL1-like repeat protein [Brevundimonas sp. PAMC22021]